MPLADGDILRVLSIVPRFDNAVTLTGQCRQPGALRLACGDAHHRPYSRQRRFADQELLEAKEWPGFYSAGRTGRDAGR